MSFHSEQKGNFRHGAAALVRELFYKCQRTVQAHAEHTTDRKSQRRTDVDSVSVSSSQVDQYLPEAGLRPKIPPKNGKQINITM